MDLNKNKITQISIDILNELIESSTHLVDIMYVQPTMTIEEVLKT